MNNIKVVLFDIDGTLVNTDELIINCYKAVFKEFNPTYKLSKEEEISFLGPPLKEMFPKYFDEDFDKLFNVYRSFAHDHMKEYAFLYDGVRQMLDLLKEKEYRLGVVTSRFKSSVMSVLEEFNLVKYFDIIISLDDVDKPKPDPEGILKCLDFYNCKPEECIYIGDTKTDYIAGKSANVKTALVEWSKTIDLKELNPDFVIKTYKDINKILNF